MQLIHLMLKLLILSKKVEKNFIKNLHHILKIILELIGVILIYSKKIY